MMKHDRRSRRARQPVAMQSLEARQLLAAAVWSDYAKLIGQDTAATKYAGLTGAGQTVAIIDTGVDYTHPNLGGGYGAGHKVIGGYDFVDNDADPLDHAEDGHGTEVAGMIAGDRFEVDGVTYQGIAPGAKLVAIRAGTFADGFSDRALQQSFDWVIANQKKYGITIVNMSLGGGAYTQAQSERVFRSQTKRLKDLGIAVIAASGNEGEDVGDTVAHPAAEPSIFAIGSVNKSDQISSFSDRGRLLDLLAPGEDVVTTQFGGDFTTTSGTSFSAPLTAGVFALVNQAAGGIMPDDVMSILRTSSRTQYDGDNESGQDADGNDYAGIVTRRAYAQLDLPAAIQLAGVRADAGTIDYFRAGKSTDFSAAYDKSGVLHQAYYDADTRHLMYVARLTDGRWTSPVTVDAGDRSGQFTSLAIDPTGKPAIAYYDAANQDLKYAWFTGERWSNQALDTSKSVGQFASLTFRSNSEPAIAYYRDTSADLRLVAYDREAKTWSRRTIASAGNTGRYASIDAFREDTSDSLSRVSYYETLAIAYADQTNGALKYWSQGTSSSGGTPYETIKTADATGGVANLSLDLIDSDGVGEARIAYQDTVRSKVKFAVRSLGDWSRTTIADGGESVDAYVGDDGLYHVAYYAASKNGSYDAAIAGNYRVNNIARIGSAGSLLAVASDHKYDGSNVTLIGLSRSGKSFQEYELA